MLRQRCLELAVFRSHEHRVWTLVKPQSCRLGLSIPIIRRLSAAIELDNLASAYENGKTSSLCDRRHVMIEANVVFRAHGQLSHLDLVEAPQVGAHGAIFLNILGCA